MDKRFHHAFLVAIYVVAIAFLFLFTVGMCWYVFVQHNPFTEGIAFGATNEVAQRPLGKEDEAIPMPLSEFQSWLSRAKKELEQKGCVSPNIAASGSDQEGFAAVWHCNAWKRKSLEEKERKK